MPDERRHNAPAQHHDSGDNANQPDLDAADIRGFLGIIAVEKAPKESRYNYGEPARLCEFGEKGNGEKTERKFLVGGSQEANCSTGNPREGGVHRVVEIQFLRRPRPEASGY